MYYYYFSEERGGILINTKTLEYTSRSADDIRSYAEDGQSIVNVVWDDFWSVKRFVDKFNKLEFRCITDSLILIQTNKYEYLWCEGVLYKLLDGDRVICVFKDGDSYIIVMFINNFSSVEFVHTEFEIIAKCSRDGIKRNLLLC